VNTKTIADWIKVKRMEKNLTPHHLAAKMGIATSLVRSWEDGSSQPDCKQLQSLANYLRLPLVRIAELGDKFTTNN
jgi:transcriptional regulator with XRE-family HTH domain